MRRGVPIHRKLCSPSACRVYVRRGCENVSLLTWYPSWCHPYVLREGVFPNMTKTSCCISCAGLGLAYPYCKELLFLPHGGCIAVVGIGFSGCLVLVICRATTNKFFFGFHTKGWTGCLNMVEYVHISLS